jgi:stage V sporulation protein B
LAESKKSNYLRGAAVLAATVAIVKVIGALYKIPLYNILGDEGTAHFQVTYTIYNLLLTISTAGIPVALSRLISAALATGKLRQVKRIHSIALPAFTVVGAVFTALMFVFARQLGELMGDYEITACVRTLSPAVLFCCIIAVYRGYSQGFEDMIPTAISQIMEVVCKLVFGLSIAWIFLRQGYGTPTISAGAIAGVTIGLGLAIPILVFYKRRLDKKNVLETARYNDTPQSRSETLKTIFKISIPITLGSAVLNIIALIDTKLVLLRLQEGAGYSYDMAKVLYGVYSKATTLYNLPSAFIVPITTSVVPAIAAAVASRRHRDAKEVMESSLRVTNLIAMPACAGLCVLAYPIFNVLYWNSNENGPLLLAIAAISAYFVCLQLMTTAILQANGFEKFPVITLPIGGLIKIVVTWFLVGNPHVGIYGAPIGTLLCYLLISLMNIIFTIWKIPNRPSFLKITLRPLICTLGMSAAAWLVYQLLFKVLSGPLGTGRLAMAVFMAGGILAALVVYVVLVIGFKALTKEDVKLLPKGDKIAKILHIK